MCTKFEKKTTDPFLSYHVHKEISTDLNPIYTRLSSGDIITLFNLIIFHLSSLVLAYVHMQRHSKSDLSLVIETVFIQEPNQNLNRSCLCLLLQPYALVFVNKYSRTRCVATLKVTFPGIC